MSQGTEVYCPNCGDLVGWDIPSSWNPNFGGEPGYFEGVDDDVEDIRDKDGQVYCSQRCLEEENPPEDEDGEV